MERKPFALAALALSIGAFAAFGAARGPRDSNSAADAKLQPLTVLHAAPLEHLGGEVRLRFVVESLPATWNPYVTRFGSGDYVAVRAWADEQRLWDVAEWKAPLATLFARRGSIAEKVLDGAPRLARFEATGRVQQVFLGRPWIEIENVQRLSSELNEGTLLHASRAMQRIEASQWSLAADELDRALSADLPQHFRDELDLLRRTCLERAGG